MLIFIFVKILSTQPNLLSIETSLLQIVFHRNSYTVLFGIKFKIIANTSQMYC